MLDLVEALSLRPDDAPGARSLDSRSCAAAIWSLSVFGGALLFEEQVDALLKVLPLPSDAALQSIAACHRGGRTHALTGSRCAVGHLV